MPGSSTGNDDDAAGLFQGIIVVFQSAKLYFSLCRIDTSAHTIAYGMCLLMYFLQHEMIIACLLQHFQLQFQLMDGGGLNLIINCLDFNPFPRNGGYFEVLQIDNILCKFNNG